MCHFVRIFIFLINPKIKLHITCSKRGCRQNLSVSLPYRSKKTSKTLHAIPPFFPSSSSFPLYHLFSIFSFPF
ncbi:hypothetical protein Hanom_Chr11g00973311 [Helianthus anomalus]